MSAVDGLFRFKRYNIDKFSYNLLNYSMKFHVSSPAAGGPFSPNLGPLIDISYLCAAALGFYSLKLQGGYIWSIDDDSGIFIFIIQHLYLKTVYQTEFWANGPLRGTVYEGING